MDSKLVLGLMLVVLGSAQGQGPRLDVLLSARNLPNMDIFNGAPDGYVKVYYTNHINEPFVLVGETDNISNNNNPDWPEMFHFFYNSTEQRVKFDVWDADSPDDDDFIGTIDAYLIDLVNARDHVWDRALNPSGTGRILVKTSVNGQTQPKFAAAFQHPSRIISVPPTNPSQPVPSRPVSPRLAHVQA